MTSAYEAIRVAAVSRLEREGLDPGRDAAAIGALVAALVEEYQREAAGGARTPLRDPEEMAARVVDAITAHGPLTRLLGDRAVEEIFIEGDQVLYVTAQGGVRSLVEPVDHHDTARLISRLLAETERRLDAASPIVQARVLGGSARLTAVIPPISDRLSATIRRYALRRATLGRLVELGSLSAPAAAFLEAAMQTTTSVVISGPPGAGKTSLLAALLAAAPSGHCVRCVEEVRELSVPLSAHSSFYEARPAGLDGGSAVGVRELVKLVLAMRPDRIVVGEVRGSEAFELTRASNAGCGFCCTVHANSARDALEALVNAALMAGENVTDGVVRRVFSTSIDLVVHLGRPGSGASPARRVMEILAVQPALGTEFTTEPVFRLTDGELRWTGALPDAALVDRIEAATGQPVRRLCEGARC